MKAYTKTDPVFSDSIQITETTDPAHADNINAAPKQLLQNTIVNKRESDKLKNPEFEDYTGDTQIPDPDDAVGMIISGEPVGTIYQYIKASLHGILTVAKKALNIAVGRNQARVFASVADLDAWLTAPENTEKLNVGDNFYIIATDVPDYWWDGTSKQKLETQKVDLTTYDQRIMANANAISELNGKLENNTFLLSGGTKIPTNADLNDYTTPGNYYHDANATVTTLKNCPVERAFTMKVINSLGGSGAGYPAQILRIYTTGVVFYRVFDYGSQWRDWTVFATESYVNSRIVKGNVVLPLTSGATEVLLIENFLSKYESSSVCVTNGDWDSCKVNIIATNKKADGHLYAVFDKAATASRIRIFYSILL